MKRWRKIMKPMALNRVLSQDTRNEKGIGFTVMVSPYAVPGTVTGEYNEDRKVLEIRFKYLDEEPAKSHQVDAHISLLEGVSSGRLLGIDVDVDRLDVHLVQVILGAIDTAITSTTSSNKQVNFKAAREVLGSAKEELLASLSG